MLIGAYKVYPNQIKAGDEYFDQLINQYIPVLCSMPQMGKTGTLIYVTHKILEFCHLNNIKNFKIIHNLHDANNDVKEQTENDYKEAFGGSHPYFGFSQVDLFGRCDNDKTKILNIIHRLGLKNIEIDPDTLFFILHDESHAAINKNGLIDTWNSKILDYSKIYEGHCSATPFALNILNEPPEFYQPIILEPSEIYSGIPDLYYADRIKQGGYLFKKSGKGRQLDPLAMNNVLANIARKVAEDGPGHVPMRDRMFSEADEVQLIEYMKKTFNLTCSVNYYNNKKKNIKFITNELNSVPNVDVNFVVIKGALRLGKRIPKHLIRCVIDTPNAQSGATTFQSLLGRVCGNDVTNFNFDVYCDLKEVKLYIDWWEGLKIGVTPLTIPSSPYNTKNVSRHMKYMMTPPGTFMKRPSDDEIKDYMNKKGLPFNIGGIVVNPHLSPKAVSTNKPTTRNGKIYHSNNMALSVVNGASRSTRIYKEDGTMNISGVYLDGPSSFYLNDWNIAMSNGYSKGEFVLFFPIKAAMVPEEISKDYLTDNCMFNDKKVA